MHVATNSRNRRRPFVSTLAVTFKKSKVSDDVEEVKMEHRNNLKTLMDSYMADVASGKAEGIKSAKEFIEVMKADLLLLGESTDRIETANTVDEIRVQQIGNLIDENSPEVASLIDEIYQGLNLANDRLGGVFKRPEDYSVPDVEYDDDSETESLEGN